MKDIEITEKLAVWVNMYFCLHRDTFVGKVITIDDYGGQQAQVS
jgi:hypothetical protein